MKQIINFFGYTLLCFSFSFQCCSGDSATGSETGECKQSNVFTELKSGRSSAVWDNFQVIDSYAYFDFGGYSIFLTNFEITDEMLNANLGFPVYSPKQDEAIIALFLNKTEKFYVGEYNWDSTDHRASPRFIGGGGGELGFNNSPSGKITVTFADEIKICGIVDVAAAGTGRSMKGEFSVPLDK